MKKLIFTTLFIGLSRIAFSQMGDTTTYVYCKAICVSQNAFNLNKQNGVDITIDFGNGEIVTPKKPMKDGSGKETDIEDAVDLMNFMSDKKWSLDNAYQLYQGNSNVKIMTTLIFKKPKYPLHNAEYQKRD